MDDIAVLAEVSKQTIYENFVDKDDDKRVGPGWRDDVLPRLARLTAELA